MLTKCKQVNNVKQNICYSENGFFWVLQLTIFLSVKNLHRILHPKTLFSRGHMEFFLLRKLSIGFIYISGENVNTSCDFISVLCISNYIEEQR